MAFCITRQSQIAWPGHYHLLWLLSQTTESPASQESSPLLRLQQPPKDDHSWQFISRSHRVLQWQNIAELLRLGFGKKEPHSYRISLFPVSPFCSPVTPTTLHTIALIFIFFSKSMRRRKGKEEGKGNRSTALFFPFRRAHCFQQQTLM